MTFFKSISQFMKGITLQLIIKEKDGQLIVSVVPQMRVEDSTKDHIPPILLKGSPEEFDESFFEQISAPLKMVSEFSVDLKSFEKSMSEAKAKSQMAKTENDEKKKLNEKIDKIASSTEELVKKTEKTDDDLKQAKNLLNKIEEILTANPDHSKARKTKESLLKFNTVSTLF